MTPEGSLKWQKLLQYVASEYAPVIDENGNIYVGDVGTNLTTVLLVPIYIPLLLKAH